MTRARRGRAPTFCGAVVLVIAASSCMILRAAFWAPTATPGAVAAGSSGGGASTETLYDLNLASPLSRGCERAFVDLGASAPSSGPPSGRYIIGAACDRDFAEDELNTVKRDLASPRMMSP